MRQSDHYRTFIFKHGGVGESVALATQFPLANQLGILSKSVIFLQDACLQSARISTSVLFEIQTCAPGACPQCALSAYDSILLPARQRPSESCIFGWFSYDAALRNPR